MFTASKRKTRRTERPVIKPIAAALLFMVTSATAQAADEAYELVVYEHSVQGKYLMKGAYDKALGVKSLAQSPSFNRANNRCVALIAKKERTEALEACDQVVEMTEIGPYSADSGFRSVRRSDRQDRAVALTNRGVLKAVSGDQVGAAEDFQAAMELDAAVKAAGSNLLTLKSSTALAGN